MNRKKIRVYRASPGTLSGEIFYLGTALLPVEHVSLGIRIERVGGNGTPSPYICKEHMSVPCVEIGGTQYVIDPNNRIIIHHDNPAVFVQLDE